MTLFTQTPEFQWALSSVAGVRPSSTWGTSVTPDNNVKGSWAEVISDTLVVNDVWGVYILFSANFVNGAARDTIVDIGYDPTGGTTYQVLIPNLLASCAGGVGMGIPYYFPIWMPAGSAIAARASVNNATVGTLRVIIKLFGLPRHPHLTRVGRYVSAVGITASTSSGASVVPGTTNEGTWVSVGTTILDHWFWQMGFGINDSGMTNGNIYASDLAFGSSETNNYILIEDYITQIQTTSELLLAQLPQPFAPHRTVPAGTNLYGRSQCSGTADSNISLAAYGVGG